jgi:hypothetical protein
LEIVRNLQQNGDKVQGAHISFKLKSVDDYLKPLKDKSKASRFISVPAPQNNAQGSSTGGAPTGP